VVQEELGKEAETLTILKAENKDVDVLKEFALFVTKFLMRSYIACCHASNNGTEQQKTVTVYH
jgi:hypothetical protein